MSFLDIPPELLYEIVTELVAEFLDYAITCAPAIDHRKVAEKIIQGQSIGLHDVGGLHQTKHFNEVGDEPLPQNHVRILFAVNHSLREITLHLLGEFLGLQRTAEGSLSSNPWVIIHDLRSHYRRAYTSGPNIHITTPLNKTSVISAYSAFCCCGFVLECLSFPAQFDESFRSIAFHVFDAAEESILSVTPQSLRRRLARRLHVQRTWATNAFLLQPCKQKRIQIYDAIQEAFRLSGSESDANFQRMCDLITSLAENIITLQREHFARLDFPFLPGPLLKGIQYLADTLTAVPSIADRGKNIAMAESVELAKGIVKDWTRLQKTTYFVDIL